MGYEAWGVLLAPLYMVVPPPGDCILAVSLIINFVQVFPAMVQLVMASQATCALDSMHTLSLLTNPLHILLEARQENVWPH